MIIVRILRIDEYLKYKRKYMIERVVVDRIEFDSNLIFSFFGFISEVFFFLFPKHIDGGVQLYMAGSRNTQRTHASEIVAFFERFGFFRPNKIVCVCVC